MFLSQNSASFLSDQPAPKLTTDYLLRWYQREYRTAATAEARASVCRNAQHDGYVAAQFAGTAVTRG